MEESNVFCIQIQTAMKKWRLSSTIVTNEFATSLAGNAVIVVKTTQRHTVTLKRIIISNMGTTLMENGN